MTTKLLASAPTFEKVQESITRFFYGSTITLTKSDDKTWTVANRKGVIGGYTVRRDGRRFRFEMDYMKRGN